MDATLSELQTLTDTLRAKLEDFCTNPEIKDQHLLNSLFESYEDCRSILTFLRLK